MKEKMSRLTTAFKEMRRARKEKTDAQNALCVNAKYSCINGLVVCGLEPTVFPINCESFRYDEVCKNNRCLMIAKNIKYFAALENYKAERQNFIKELFSLNKMKTN